MLSSSEFSLVLIVSSVCQSRGLPSESLFNFLITLASPDFLMSLPKYSASKNPASFPLGSMSPCSRSQIAKWSPSRKLAEVPLTIEASSVTSIRVVLKFNEYRLHSFNTVIHTMILVKLAISLTSFSSLPKSRSPLVPFTTAQHRLVTKGGGISSNVLIQNNLFLT